MSRKKKPLATSQQADRYPVAVYFGTMPNLWTVPGQDAVKYTRALRDEMQPKLGK